GPDCVPLIRRLEALALRRPPRLRPGCGPLLHQAQNHHAALAVGRCSRGGRVLVPIDEVALRSQEQRQSFVRSPYASGRRSRKNCQVFRTSSIVSRSHVATTSSVLSSEPTESMLPRGSTM